MDQQSAMDDNQIDADATDDRLIKLLDEATEILSRFVVPLYMERRGKPVHFGTGFLVRAGSTNFLVSAAHVLERASELFYYIESKTTAKLSGERRLSRWSGDREHDP